MLVGVPVRRARSCCFFRKSPSLRFVGFPLTPLLDIVAFVTLSIFGKISHNSWLIALAVTVDLHPTCRLGLRGHAHFRNVGSPLELVPGSGCRFAPAFAGGCDCDPHAACSSTCNMQSLITVNSSIISFGVCSRVVRASAFSAVQDRALIEVQFPLVLVLPVLLHQAINSRFRSRLAKGFRSVSADRRLRSSALLEQDC